MPAAFASAGEAKSRGAPSMTILPPLGRSPPEMILTSVDLPAPLSPRRATTSPLRISMSTPFSASIAPKFLLIASSFRSGGYSLNARPPRPCKGIARRPVGGRLGRARKARRQHLRNGKRGRPAQHGIGAASREDDPRVAAVAPRGKRVWQARRQCKQLQPQFHG